MRPLHAWYERHRGGRFLLLVWIATRLVMIAILAIGERYITGDVFYYRRKISALADVGLSATLNEYPTPVVWILSLPYGLAGGTRTGYLIAYVLLMVALDGAFLLALYRLAGRRHDVAADVWVLFVFLIGPLAYLRLDLLPAVLAGGALLLARRKPALAGAMTGLGAAVKLWPALLIAALLAHKPDRRAAGPAFVGVGFGLAAVSLIAGGWARLISPLTWQSDRGLQIESIWATPLMIARAADPFTWRVAISRYQAYEVFGPGVDIALLVSTVATAVGLVVIAALIVRLYRARTPTYVAVGLVMVATVAIMIVTNKTLSPQYVLWLGGPLAALLVHRDETRPDERRVIVRGATALIVLALLTQLVYPILYNGYLGRGSDTALVVSTAVTAIRNVALFAFTVFICRAAWRVSADLRP